MGGAVIGTLRSVNDETASVFAQQLYMQLFKGVKLGEGVQVVNMIMPETRILLIISMDIQMFGLEHRS
ncbi:MAG: hypothetical protein WA667_20715 [Candidatus Nitrosopolaris sp.]